MSNYLQNDKPPVCLHILGQGLVNALHAEGRKAIEEARTAALDAAIAECDKAAVEFKDYVSAHKAALYCASSIKILKLDYAKRTLDSNPT